MAYIYKRNARHYNVKSVKMPKTKNARNCSTYKWHVTGELAGNQIDKKYCSINIFIEEFGGDKTPLNLDKSKVTRLRKNWADGKKKADIYKDPTDEIVAKNWRVIFTPIREKRTVRMVYDD
jgi:hypothetical protein